MELSELGLDSQLQELADKLCGPGQRLARVTAVDRGRWCAMKRAWSRSTRARC